MTGEIGWIYTLHLHERLGREGRNGALHYTGWASRGGLLARLQAHRSGHSDAAMMRWCAAHGITWHLADLRAGTRTEERRLKNRGASARCLTCGPAPGPRSAG